MLTALKVGAILGFAGWAGVGCAFVDRDVPLVYKAQGAPQPIGHVKVSVACLDERAEPGKLGDVENFEGARTATIRAKDAVRGWIADGLVQELQRAGVNAILAEGSPLDGPHISMRVIQAACLMRSRYEAKLALRIEMGGPNVTSFDKTFGVKGTFGVNLVGSSTGCAEAMNDALRKVLKIALPEILAALGCP